MTDPEVFCFITKILCAHRGRMTLEELLGEIRLPEAQLYELLKTAGPDRFVLLETGDQAGITRSVVATTRARVCRRKYCQRPCDSLHLCKLNLLGRCHYAQSQRNLCKYSHDVLSEQNFQVLKNHELSGLNQEELAVLLVQSDPFFLPEICKSYKGEGRKQVCGQPQPCERLHICEHFTRGNCSYLNCLRSHNLMDRKVLAIMREHGLSSDVVQNIQDICNNKHTRRNPPGMRAPNPHRRGGAHRERSKSRDRFLHNNLELFSTVSPLGSGPPSPDVTSCKDSLEDVSAEVTQKFKYLGTQDREQLSLVSSKAAGVRGPSPMRASQEFSENGDPDGLFSRNRSDSSSSRASAASFPLDAAQRNEAVAMKTGVPSGHLMEVKGKNKVPDIDHVPLLNSYIDEVTTEEATISGILGHRATANSLEEMILSSNHQKSVAKTQDPQTAGRITDSGQDMAFLRSKYGENSAWAGTPTQNGPNGSSQIMDEMPNVSKSSPTGFGVKSAVTGGKEAIYPAVQSLRNQVLAMPGEATTPVQGSNRLPPSPLSSSSHRVVASGSPGKNSTHASVSPASEPSRMTSSPAEYLPHYIITPTSPRMDDHGPKEICPDHLYKGCQQSDCNKSHFHLPYRWQLFMFTTWMDFQDMESIEQAYCDPKVEIILIEKHQINFQKMTCDSFRIRRLSTPSLGKNPPNSVFATKWLWYWKNELNEYIQYGDESPSHTISDINSTYLESFFNFCPRGVLPFHAGSQNYEISFQGMIQTNIASKTQRHVVRRPVFVSSEDVVQKRRGPDHQPVMPQADVLTLYSPPQRNTSTVPPNEYEFLELHSQDKEYFTISELFKASMKHFKIVKIKRIWNQKLWDIFDRKKQKMKNKNEMQLFKAACHNHVDYICKNNFEWILHGNQETRYGKGNYFAKEAICAHKSCSYDTRGTVMFVARVLVGNVIEGNITFSSPPALYDSCVDTRLNPSVFVIFRKEQIYPEYVIEYVESEKEKSCVIS
ncbi:zinc finger CCCH-type antiviral protein 1 [Mastomys coucha]|uniref:zinc finger CCCH-type antiviral protein 1 n=1 Tax=Mastomys coucha TaxID=35658 RepID=UPI00126183BD|nr:zinc finger CCCH-type antiviral protein 1 [Mastomys coucha]